MFRLDFLFPSFTRCEENPPLFPSNPWKSVRREAALLSLPSFFSFGTGDVLVISEIYFFLFLTGAQKEDRVPRLAMGSLPPSFFFLILGQSMRRNAAGAHRYGEADDIGLFFFPLYTLRPYERLPLLRQSIYICGFLPPFLFFAARCLDGKHASPSEGDRSGVFFWCHGGRSPSRTNWLLSPSPHLGSMIVYFLYSNRKIRFASSFLSSERNYHLSYDRGSA